jgi:predicted transposase YbfD/YdcC
MSKYYGYRAVGDFIKRNRTDLIEQFKPKKDRLPTFYTVRRVLQGIDFSLLSEQFHQWALQYVCISEQEWVSIDGKRIGGTTTNSKNTNQHFINLVSLYCSKQKLVIGNALVSNSKESEIPVVQQLIEALDIKGVTFTLDALHCQKKTSEVIINSGNDYVLGVKGNQPKLLEQIKHVTSNRDQISSSYIEMEINRGRTELRCVSVSDCIENISKEWVGLKQLISVYRKVKEKGKTREELAYFISSRQSNAFYYSEGIRLHWEIENSLHYVKDVTFEEDASKIRTSNAPQNISTIKNIAINILRKNEYGNMAQAMRLVSNNISVIKNMVA